MAEKEVNPYIGPDLTKARRIYCREKNKQFEKKHAVAKKKDNDRNYKKVWRELSDEEEEESITDDSTDPAVDRSLRGNLENTEKLVAKYVRDREDELAVDIPGCIESLCFQFSYEPTNVVFNEWDDRISQYVVPSNKGKMVNITSRTVFLFSEEGYNSGHHIWHVKLHRVYNCQALGITEHKNSKYRYGDNIFDVALNQQLGDRYIYAGDNGHSWRGSQDLRPYVCSVIDDEEYYTKRLYLKNSRWNIGDIITVDLHLGSERKDDDSKRTITFLKNGKRLFEPITVVKRCKYYPVFQCYQRGSFEIIDDITKEPIYQPETEENSI